MQEMLVHAVEPAGARNAKFSRHGSGSSRRADPSTCFSKVENGVRGALTVRRIDEVQPSNVNKGHKLSIKEGERPFGIGKPERSEEPSRKLRCTSDMPMLQKPSDPSSPSRLLQSNSVDRTSSKAHRGTPQHEEDSVDQGDVVGAVRPPRITCIRLELHPGRRDTPGNLPSATPHPPRALKSKRKKVHLRIQAPIKTPMQDWAGESIWRGVHTRPTQKRHPRERLTTLR